MVVSVFNAFFILFFVLQRMHGSYYIMLFMTLLYGFYYYSRNKVKNNLSLYLFLVVIVYLFYLIIGISNNHSSLIADIKIQVTSFLFYLILLSTQGKNINWEEILFGFNYVIFFIYLFLFLGIMPNLWSNLTFGFEKRMYGPSLNGIVLLLFYYLLNEKKIDRKIVVAFILGLIYTASSQSVMNISITIILFILLAVRKEYFFRGVLLLGIFVVMSLFLMPEYALHKMSFIFRPWEYRSFQTRISDLAQVFSTTDFTWFNVIFGEGFGASTRVFRYIVEKPELSLFETFLEVDNGFYYIYHRGGLSLLVLFLAGHYILLKMIPSFKGRVAFMTIFFIINILTIHYCTHFIFLLIPFWIIENYGKEKKIFRQKLVFKIHNNFFNKNIALTKIKF